jgi:hypothetical protein
MARANAEIQASRARYSAGQLAAGYSSRVIYALGQAGNAAVQYALDLRRRG